MKNFSKICLTLSILLMIFNISCSSNSEEKPVSKTSLSSKSKVNFEQLAFVETLAKAVQKKQMVMVDFYSKGCSGCKDLERDVFQDSESAAYINSRFTSLKVNGDKGEGAELRKKYVVPGYPNVLILKATGEEIDRISGFRGKDAFMKTLKEYAEGKNTLPSLLFQLEKEPENVQLIMKLARKYIARWQLKEAYPYFVKILELDPANEEGFKTEAIYSMAVYEARYNKNIQPLELFLAENSDENYFNGGYANLINFFETQKNHVKTVETYEKAIKRMPLDSKLSNDFAWYIYKNRIKENYARGIEVAKKTLEARPKAANVWDTLAWLYYENGDRQNALEAMKKAVEFSSESLRNRFQERLEKIQNGTG